MAPRSSARVVGIARKETKTTGEDADQVMVEESFARVEESSVRVEAVAVEQRTATPPTIVKVVPVEESGKKKATREEKAKENAETPAVASSAEKEQQGEKMRKEATETGGAPEAQQKVKEATETGTAKETEKKVERKIGKKKTKRRGSGGCGDGYRRYVFRVLKQVQPGLRVSSMAMAVLDGFMNDMFERIVGQAAQLSKYSGRMTLSAKEIQGAVRLVIPGELGKHAVAEGVKAVTNYYSTVKPPP